MSAIKKSEKATTWLSTTRATGSKLLSLLVLSASLASCSEDAVVQQPKRVNVYQIEEMSSLAGRSFPGLAAASNEANMSFRVAGPLVEMPVTVGDVVEKGDVVARVDPHDYQVRVRNAEALLEVAKAANKRSEADYRRLKNTQDEDAGATSQRAVDFALANRDETRAAVSSAEATLESARDRLAYTELKAPFGGRVAETYVENYETILPLQPIIRLIGSGQIEMTLAVPEVLIGYADQIVDASVEFDAVPGKRFVAQVSEVGTEATQVTRTYPLTLAIDADDEVILPGMAGQAYLTAQLEEMPQNVFHVPVTSVFSGLDDSSSYVWLVRDDRVVSKQVTIRRVTATGFEIEQGLEAGDAIVLNGVSQLRENQLVQVISGGSEE